MLRLVGFFLLAFLVLQALRLVPVVGELFKIPFLGFFLATALVAAAFSKLASDAVGKRRRKNAMARFGSVETPHNQGKLGSLLLADGRAKEAIVCLERAVQGEPDSLEWRYRLGCALLERERFAEAARELAAVAARDEDYAYGAVQLRLAQAQVGAGQAQDSLATLERHARSQGVVPEALYRQALALKKLGRAAEARAALAGVPVVARTRAGFQKKGDTKWVWLAMWRRWF